jgi:hypothetical protein
MQLTWNSFSSFMKSLAVFGVIWLLVLLINYPIISFDMMYQEQPIIYLVNQQITSIHDLLQVYLHPAMLETLTIPFFRPSGHFLIYQIITSFLDWHNTKGFLIVSFFFLALVCQLIIKFFKLLFPHFRIGGYLACGIYLMHPALAMSRLTPMHFEFASVAFMLLGLYCFALFCQKNNIAQLNTQTIRLKNLSYLSLSLLFYGISVTFKETTLMLGPVLALYLCLAPYQGQSLSAYLARLIRVKEFRQILVILTSITLLLVTYISMAWPGLSHPLQNIDNFATPPGVLFNLLQMVFGFWTNVLFPAPVQWILRGLLGCLLVSGYLLYRGPAPKIYRKSFLFLILAGLAFMLLPILWGRGKPWHLSLSLVFVSLLSGFSLEYLGHLFIRNKALVNKTGIVFATALGLAAFAVASSNTHYFNTDAALRTNRNAVFNAPAIKNQLNTESVVIVEDNILRDSYLLGDSIYPQEAFVNNFELKRLIPIQGFYQSPNVYGGTLFKWAYKLPALNEQVYPFDITKMQTIPSITIYNWLQHINNIFCLGYDKTGSWFDRTAAFKQNLLAEQSRRHLLVKHYQILPANAFANTAAVIRLPFADPGYCQFRCDGNKNCTGFTYVLSGKNGGVAYCYFHPVAKSVARQECHTCKEYIKV